MRAVVGTLLVVSLVWAATNLLRDTDSTMRQEASPESAADRRQHEILDAAIESIPDPTLVRVYSEINHRHFGGRLPEMPVVWEPRLREVGTLARDAFVLEGMFGRIGDRTIILLNPDLAPDPAAVRRALSHEMVHAWLHTIGHDAADHGPAFQAALKRLADEGAFAGLAASDAERDGVRAWLESESARLDTHNREARQEDETLAREAREIEQDFQTLQDHHDDTSVAAWRHRRDAYNRRLAEFRARADRYQRDLTAYNAQVERYKLMMSYPHGLDE